MIRYPTLSDCREILFPLIRRRMAVREPAPYYEGERTGVEHLEGILALMRRSEYRGVLRKAAYLFCSVIDGHHFSNGNKRLAVALIAYFLLANGFRTHVLRMAAVEKELRAAFPQMEWEEEEEFSQPHEAFFYHLALILADRKRKGAISFSREQEIVVSLFQRFIHRGDRL